MFWKKKETVEVKTPEEKPNRANFFSTAAAVPRTIEARRAMLGNALRTTFQKTEDDFKVFDATGVAMDSTAMDNYSVGRGKLGFGNFGFGGIPEAQIGWYGNQGFIGYQLCAMIAQNWLIDKACTIPARDAIRNGWTITVNDGTEVETMVLDELRVIDKRMNLNDNLLQYIRMGRVFGIRIMMFKVESSDPEYYEKPFNIDGVLPGSYKGMSQIDPYWITPMLDQEAASDPSSMHFYEPTWWQVSGQRIHRSHLVIFKTNEVPDVLKPSYLYGGVSVPQKIYERVYAAERTANEAPILAMTKRLNIRKIDITTAVADEAAFQAKIEWQNYQRDNHGTLFAGLDEAVEQLETTLTDLDVTIMTQYQLVAAGANVPATKLLGTTPKGFNSTGEYEEASYHEELESIQTHDLTPVIERHYQLCIKSEIEPKFKTIFSATVTWSPLDSPTAKELAEMNKLKAETGAALAASGAIDGEDERNRLINDPDSGYDGMEAGAPEEEEEEFQDPEQGEVDDPAKE